jgi:hypothetical protein
MAVDDVVIGLLKNVYSTESCPAEIVLAVVDAPVFVKSHREKSMPPDPEEENSVIPVVPISPRQFFAYINEDELEDVYEIPV